jgi:peroxiredoxin
MQTYNDVAMRQPDERMVLTWDAHRLLVYDSGAEPRYALYEAPREHPDTWSMVEDWLSPPPAPLPGRTCRRLAAVRSIIGRQAVGYSCHYRATDMTEASDDTAWVDRRTGVLLQEPYLRAQSVVERRRVGPATFSTVPPAGAAVSVVPARSSGGRVRAPEFTLTRSGGGRIASTDFRGRPFVLAFFPTNLAPGTADASVQSLITLQQLTAGGTKPAVVAVHVGPDGMPPLEPPGVTLPLGFDDTARVEHAFGLTGEFAFAFVRSDGTVSATFDRPATPVELQRGLSGLG